MEEAKMFHVKHFVMISLPCCWILYSTNYIKAPLSKGSCCIKSHHTQASLVQREVVFAVQKPEGL